MHAKHLTPLEKDNQTSQSSLRAWQWLQKLRCTADLWLTRQLGLNKVSKLFQSSGTLVNCEGWVSDTWTKILEPTAVIQSAYIPQQKVYKVYIYI